MKKFSQLAFPYIVWAVLMLVFPMVLIALYSVTDQGNTILSFTFTLEHYAKFFTVPDFLLILWRSIVIGVTAESCAVECRSGLVDAVEGAGGGFESSLCV